jgi:hypothetical protein
MVTATWGLSIEPNLEKTMFCMPCCHVLHARLFYCRPCKVRDIAAPEQPSVMHRCYLQPRPRVDIHAYALPTHDIMHVHTTKSPQREKSSIMALCVIQV